MNIIPIVAWSNYLANLTETPIESSQKCTEIRFKTMENQVHVKNSSIQIAEFYSFKLPKFLYKSFVK